MAAEERMRDYASAATGLQGLQASPVVDESDSTRRAPILALHGWLDNAESFRPLAAELPEYPLIAPDLPGHGLSPWQTNQDGYVIWSSTGFLHQLLNELGEPVHLIGHSMGGAIGLLLAATYPEQVLSFTLLDSAGPLSTPAEDVAQQLRKSLDATPREARTFRTQGEALAVRHTASHLMTADDLRPMVLRNLQAVDGGWQWRWDPRLRLPSTVRLTEDQISGLFRSLQCPLLALRATEGLMPETWFRQRVAAAPQLTVKELPGHHHFHMSPDTLPAVAQSIRQCLSNV